MKRAIWKSEYQSSDGSEIKSLDGFYLIISNIVAMSSVAIVTFDFSIKMFFPVIMYDGITRIPS